MSLEFDIARRLSQRGGGRRSGIMERVAVTATAVSVTVMMLTLSVVVGFKHDLTRIVTGATAGVTVTAPQSGGVISGVGLERDGRLERIMTECEGIEHVAPFAAKEGVMKNDDNTAGVIVKGVDSLYDWRFMEGCLRRGRLPRIGGLPRVKEILISEQTARAMAVDTADRIEMIFVTGQEARRDRFSISGIYSTGVEMIDATVVMTDLRNVQRLCDWPEQTVTGYELRTEDPRRAAQIAERLNEEFVGLYLDEGIDAEAFAVEQIYPNIFGWLATHDINAAVMVAIMIVVALLNMITVLLIIVLERSRMIGELKAMGMNNRSLTLLFFYRAAFIALRGIAWGVAAGLALCWVQHSTGILTLPSDGYFLSHVPVAFCWGVWAAAIAAASAVIMCVMLLPAAFARRISPAETMRYE